MHLRPVYLFLMFIVIVTLPQEIKARPMHQSPILVGVCYTDAACGSPNGVNFEASTLDIYVEKVLANEWHVAATLQALQAGAVAIRTFAYRDIGCGAYHSTYIEPGPPPLAYRILNNDSQVFRIGGAGGTQNPVTSDHIQARSNTQNEFILRSSDDNFACAKYNANNGNPTLANNAEIETLQEVADPVHDNTCTGCVGPRTASGMSQNGSVAWAKGNTPWDYRQILTHYYTAIKVSGPNTTSETYRWTWLDVDQSTVVHSGYASFPGDYYGPTTNIPAAMEVGQNYVFSIHLQNASTVNWQRFGSNQTQIGLYWDDNRNAATLFSLDEDMDPGEDDNVTLSISPPASGTHCLSVDMYRNGQWFSDQSSPAWPVLSKCISVAEADTTPPTNPNNQNGSHSYNQWSNDNTIYAQWSGASDNRTPASQLVYSVDWTTSGSTVPDTGVDETDTGTTSPALGDGNWYLHVRTRDNAGNWNNGAAHFGPFKIDTTPPQATHDAPAWSPTADFTVAWIGQDSGGSGITFDFDYRINNGAYQNWFETSVAPDSKLYNLGANPDDTVTIRSCVQDGAGNPASPNACTVTQTQFRTAPYLNTDPTKITHCFVLTETVPFSGTMLVKNDGPDFLDWNAAISHTYLTLWPITGTQVNSGLPSQTVYTLTNPAAVGQYTGVITVGSSTPGVNNNPVIVPVTVRVVGDACTFYYHLPIILKQN